MLTVDCEAMASFVYDLARILEHQVSDRKELVGALNRSFELLCDTPPPAPIKVKN